MVRIVLLRFMESYFRHRWLYLLPLVITFVAGSLYVLNAQPVYKAAGRLYIEKDSLLASLTATANDGSFWVTPAQATTNEVHELLGSEAFARAVIQKTDLEQYMSSGQDAVDRTLLYFRKALSVNPQGDKLVEISATTADPKLAHQIVVATMESFVQWKLNSDFQESVAAQNFFEAQIAPYQDEVDAARAELVDFLDANPLPVRGDRLPQEQMELDSLQAAVQSAEERLAAAQSSEESARLAQAQSESVTRQTYQVIDQPQMPTEPLGSLRELAINLVIFLAVGVVMTLVGISAGALLDRSLRFPIDVRHGLSLPVLAMVPIGGLVSAPAVKMISTDEQVKGDAAQKADSSTLQPQL